MGKNKSSKFFQGKEAFQRMNFLFQASEFLMSSVNQPSLAAYYGSQMTSICKKSVLRMEPRVKRQLCKGCRAPLVSGVSSRLRLNSSSKNVVITCLQCGTIKRFPMKPGYRVWVETPEACVETLSTGVTDQTSTQFAKKENQCKESKDGKEIPAVNVNKITEGDSVRKKQPESLESNAEGQSCEQKSGVVLVTNESHVEVSQNKVVCSKAVSAMEMIVSENIVSQDISHSKV